MTPPDYVAVERLLAGRLRSVHAHPVDVAEAIRQLLAQDQTDSAIVGRLGCRHNTVRTIRSGA